MSRRAPALVIVSLLGHALFLGLGAPRARPSMPPPVLAVTGAVAAVGDAIVRSERAGHARRGLVEGARNDLAAGSLRLGRFLLEAGRIDAEERGEELDTEEAAARYEERLGALREALRTADVIEAVPRVFGDLRYHGEPGGRMADALLEGGGSCEQVAQLVAAAVFDAGRSREIALRFYGAPMSDGVTHLAPIALRGREEHDLMSGKPAILRGSRWRAEELVEVYARAHGLAPPLASANGDGPSAGAQTQNVALEETSNRPTLASGFPPNADAYPGRLPLYAARAVQDPTEAAFDLPPDDMADIQRARDCAYFLRMAMLSPPEVEVRPGLDESGFDVEPRHVPKPGRLEREASLLGAAQRLLQSAEADLADKIMGHACLAALGDMAAVDFALAGEHRLASKAMQSRKAAREEGKKALAAIAWSTEEGKRIARRLSKEFGGRTWLLLALEGGDEAVLTLARGADRDDWGWVTELSALVLWSPTRERALALVEALPVRKQIEVMHEIFHVHDHMRPWASNFDFGAAPAGGEAGARFFKVYRVFRGLAWRLWEGQRDVHEILLALRRESSEAGLDQASEAALLDYCANNALSLYAQRASGMAVVRLLAQAVRQNGHGSLFATEQVLAHIERTNRLDPKAIADAARAVR
ncbi:hypothetical protein [Polyangium aurulentum]|uniref:hypothetical protein n=1 Tax=Polyangium aurulentum TaxID=2567896 RepID=UPI0010ADAE90|nr:hypothetical protein [Polyangium aurulentum]UQA60689.1 hypothetical protein E8A73_009505 [Polyangium aurulentum]